MDRYDLNQIAIAAESVPQQAADAVSMEKQATRAVIAAGAIAVLTIPLFGWGGEWGVAAAVCLWLLAAGAAEYGVRRLHYMQVAADKVETAMSWLRSLTQLECKWEGRPDSVMLNGRPTTFTDFFAKCRGASGVLVGGNALYHDFFAQHPGQPA